MGYRTEPYTISELSRDDRLAWAAQIADERETLANALYVLERNDDWHVADRLREVIRNMQRTIFELWCEHANWTSNVWDGVREYDCDDCGRSITAEEAGDTE